MTTSADPHRATPTGKSSTAAERAARIREVLRESDRVERRSIPVLRKAGFLRGR